MTQDFLVEMTDTYGGEANYSWVNKFRVRAASRRGAILKVARETGFSGRMRKADEFSDFTSHNVQGACIRFFTYEWNDEFERFGKIKAKTL